MQQTCFIQDRSAATIVSRYENLPSLLLKGGAQSENYLIRTEILKRIKDIIRHRQNTPDMQHMLKIVGALVFEIQPKMEQNEARCT